MESWQKKLIGKKKYNIDYFGYAVNLESKFKLNFDEEENRKKSQNSKKIN